MSTKKSIKKAVKKGSKVSINKTQGAATARSAKPPKRALAKVATKKPPAAKFALKKALVTKVAAKNAPVAKVVAKKTPVAKAAAKPATIASASDFMVHAYAMETEAAERYAEFADSMEMHNNLEVAELFRKLSRIEQRHADQILEQMGWKQSPVSSANYRWEGTEGPETADSTELHYLMQPYHALQIALINEKRARDFFARLATTTTNAGVRKGALEMQEEEAEHMRLIEEWLRRTPVPDSNWENDPDPPVLSD